MKRLFFVVGVVLLSACESGSGIEEKEAAVSTKVFDITNLSDEEYPDNPDIGFRATDYKFDYFSKGRIERSSDAAFVFDIVFHTENGDSVGVDEISLSEYIPTIPEAISDDPYLSYISCVNQEWNRNQVRFDRGTFFASDSAIVRIDIARNCLEAYLWEVIAYSEKDGKQVPYAHGWFEFPHDTYAELFETKNGVDFDQYRQPLESWVEPRNQVLDLNKLRSPLAKIEIEFNDASEMMYPVKGAREKKFKEIIYPSSFTMMKDLQTDSALFATFTPPGFYNRDDPRKTQLGRFYYLNAIEVSRTTSKLNGDTLIELRMDFTHRNDTTKTTVLYGGIDPDQIPVLPVEEANSGWKNSMGIANHSFYEKYHDHTNISSRNNPYYGLTLDEQGRWLDSHEIGIDGPVMHFTDDERTELHVWLLSFERHALVGHYVVKLTRNVSWFQSGEAS